MNKELDKLISFISKNFPFNGSKYPDLQDQTDEQKVLRFGLKHVGLHMAKALGKVSNASERLDHGKEFDLSEIKAEAVNSVINGLKLADLLKVSGSELIQAMEDKYHDKIEEN